MGFFIAFFGVYDIIYLRGKDMNSNKVNYIANYNKENYKMYQFRIKKSDAKIIEKLDVIANRNRYITNLIRKDISSTVLTIKQIKLLIKPAIDKHHITDVYLFGSYARGEANNDSDVDIYCSSGDLQSLTDLAAFKEELSHALGKEVDVITIGSQMHDYFKKQLEEDMIKIC